MTISSCAFISRPACSGWNTHFCSMSVLPSSFCPRGQSGGFYTSALRPSVRCCGVGRAGLPCGQSCSRHASCSAALAALSSASPHDFSSFSGVLASLYRLYLQLNQFASVPEFGFRVPRSLVHRNIAVPALALSAPPTFSSVISDRRKAADRLTSLSTLWPSATFTVCSSALLWLARHLCLRIVSYPAL